ncbi:MAG TPA: molybdenum cofactor biosynthesis protein MoaE [Gemmatimonas sp.]|nr:molybdenum cofactor biosynthesis protein MoaE [Gemmatimonas sp.]
MASGVLHVAIVHDPIDPANLASRVQHAGIGAVSLFLGTVRDLNDGRAVSGMEYEAYVGMADSELRAIAREACAPDPELVVAVEHRIGTLAIGDVSVAIACAHPHRGPAMDATRRIIDELKSRVPIWKKEHYLDGERVWIDPTASRQVPQSVPARETS